MLAALALAVLAVSSSALFILLAAPLPSLVIAAGRVTVTAATLFALRAGVVSRALRGRGGHNWFVVSAGLFLAVHFATWVASLQATTVVRAVTLVALQPLFVAAYAR